MTISRWRLPAGIALAFLLGGCAQVERLPVLDGTETVEPTVVFEPSPAAFVLSCLEETRSLKRRELDQYYDEARAHIDGNASDEDRLRFLCLSLHPKADYRQFREGTQLLEQYLNTHPDADTALLGLSQLLQRLDQAKIARWSAVKKLMEEKRDLEEQLEAVTAELQQCRQELEERQVKDLAGKSREELEKELVALKQRLQEAAIRNDELKKQIEQLKNIENIIKNRERAD